MKGTKPLDNDEIRSVSTCFTGTFETRNRGLFMLGVNTGGRTSELLSLQIGDVFQNGSAVTDLLFERSIVKGGEVSRAVPVNADGRRELMNSSAGTGRNTKRSLQHVHCSHRGIETAQSQCTGRRHTRCSNRLFWRRGSTASLRHTAYANLLPSASMSRAGTSIWCRSFWVTGV